VEHMPQAILLYNNEFLSLLADFSLPNTPQTYVNLKNLVVQTNRAFSEIFGSDDDLDAVTMGIQTRMFGLYMFEKNGNQDYQLYDAKMEDLFV